MELAVVYMMQGGLFSLLTYRISCFKGWVCAEVVSAAAQQAGCKLITADAEWGVESHSHCHCHTVTGDEGFKNRTSATQK